jgi:hypothetical protein
VFGFTTEEVMDVTERYTSNYDEVLKRRKMVSEEWLKETIQNLNFQLSIFIEPERNNENEKRRNKEVEEFSSKKMIKTNDELEGIF